MWIVPFIPVWYWGPPCLSCSHVPAGVVPSLILVWVVSLSLAAATMLVGLTLALAGRRWDLFLGGLLIVLAAAYLSGFVFYAIVHVSSNVTTGLPWTLATASTGPLLAILSGVSLVRKHSA